jgi:hypothetical protein
VADVAADVNGVVTTDGAGGRGEGVGGTEDGTAGLDGVTALPDHGADGARVHVCCNVSIERSIAWRRNREGRTVDEASEEGLVGEISV